MFKIYILDDFFWIHNSNLHSRIHQKQVERHGFTYTLYK